MSERQRHCKKRDRWRQQQKANPSSTSSCQDCSNNRKQQAICQECVGQEVEQSSRISPTVLVAAARNTQTMFGKLKQRLAGAGGSHQLQHSPTSTADPRSSLKGVGQTERLVSRSVRIQNKNKSKKQQQQSSQPSSPKQPLPQLNGSGHLTTEEVVRRTSSSVVTKELLLGSQKDPIHLEVCRRRSLCLVCVLFVVCYCCKEGGAESAAEEPLRAIDVGSHHDDCC